MPFIEEFKQNSLPQNFYWFNEPPRYMTGNGLEIFTGEKTDFWQKTHYGFQPDNGHCLLTKQTGDFSLLTRVEFPPVEKYEQCGLIIRLDSENWIKVSTEYESEACSRLGSVVTNLGYSDWATQDIPSTHREMSYRISKKGSDFLLENSFEGHVWQQMRVTHLHKVPEYYEVGLYDCSPLSKDFWCRFKMLEITENQWR